MRPRPLALALAAHVLVVGLLLVAERRFRAERPTETLLIPVMPITQMRQAPPVARSPNPLPAATRPPGRPPQSLQPAPPLPVAPDVESQSITEPPRPPPRIDWQREMERAVRESAQSEESVARYRSLDAQPKALDLPEADDEPPDGTVYRLPNGDKVARFKVGDRIVTCTSPQVALDEHFAVWAQFRPARCSSRKPGSAFLPSPPARTQTKPP
jgi:hypothetical protein